MLCPKCETDNPVDAKFCSECGSSLELHCSNCDAALPPDAKFCHECGTKVEASEAAGRPRDRLRQYMPDGLARKLEGATQRGAMVGGRRVVTMLFCDVQGSTAAAEKLDPEEWAEIMNGGFEHLISPVYRYEGTLARIMGDAILGFFGAPIAHEDDPERAILAGLDIIETTRGYADEVRSRYGIDFGVRVGINTGLVVVGEVGSDLHVEYTAMGDAVNLAARMEQTADVGTIRVTADTQRLVAGVFEFEALGPLDVKGKAEPVEAFRVLGKRQTRGRQRGIEGLHSPLVGRNAEMTTLRRIIDELVSGRGQVASVVAEAGLGKSRLITELRQNLEAEGLMGWEGGEAHQIGWVEGRSFSYDRTTPYAPIVDLFSSCFGMEPGDDSARRYEKIATTVEAVLPDEVDTTVPYLASLFGLDLSSEDAEMVRYLQPPQLRERVFDAAYRVVAGMARKRPLVMVLDDLHWIDSTSIDLLEHLMAVTDDALVLILALFRPSRDDPSWRFHEKASRDFYHRYTQVLLLPLDETQSRDLVRNLLHVEGLPDSTRHLILAKSEGNPFFVEEVIRSLLDAGVIVRDGDGFRTTEEINDIAVPNTLAAVLTTRLDRLPEETKLVAQTAAVIGREFSLDTLNDVHPGHEDAGRHLGELVRRELVREKGRVGDRTYTFKHALTRQTAYDSVLLKRRRSIHLGVGEFLETTSPDRVHDIARHFSEAGEKTRALPYLVAAGSGSLGAYSMPDAISYFRQALDSHDETSEATLVKHAYEGLMGALAFSNDVEGALETLDLMLEEGLRRDDVPMQVSALNKKGITLALRIGDLEQGEQLLARAKHLAEAEGDHTGLAEFHVAYCYVNTSEGRLEKAKEHQLESTRIGIEAESAFDRVFGLVHYADTLLYLADFAAVGPAIEEARRVAEELGEQQFLGLVTGHTLAYYLANQGELEEALKMAKEGLEITSAIGAVVEAATCAWTAGQIAALKGEYDQALSFFRQAADDAGVAGLVYIIASAASARALIHHAIGGNREERVAPLLTKAVELLDEPLGGAYAAATWGDVALCALDMGDLDSAALGVEKGLNAVSALSHLARPWLLATGALVSIARGDLEEAAGRVAEAAAYAAANSIRVAEPFVSYAEGELQAARGDVDGAVAAFSEASHGALSMGLLPLLARSHRAAARTLQVAGRDEDAAAEDQAASRARHDIAAMFGEGELRAKYLATASAG